MCVAGRTHAELARILADARRQIQQSDELDNQLSRMKGKASDEAAKVMFNARNANRNAFLAGEKKKEAVARRQVAADKDR